MTNRKPVIGFRLLVILGLTFSLAFLTIGCGGGGGGDSDGDNDSSSSHLLEGTYVSYVNKNELILKVTDSNSSCFYPGNQLYYEIESISPTELVLREDDGDLFTWINNSNTNQGLLGTWTNSKDLDDHLTFNADQTWYLDGTVDCSPIIYDSTFGSYDVNGNTMIAKDVLISMNFDIPKRLSIDIIVDDEEPKEKVQFHTEYTSKLSFDSDFINDSLILDSSNILRAYLKTDGSTNDLSQLDFYMVVTKNQDGTYDFSSEGTLVSYNKTWTVYNIIGENVSFVAINGY